MNFIPFHSPKGTVDLTIAEADHRAALERHMEKMRRITVRWIPALKFIQSLRPEMHWCSYSEGRVVAFVTLDHDESFADLEAIYEFASAEVRSLQKLGNYRGEFVDRPDPVDDFDIHWRKWIFQAGDSRLEINCSFSFSRHCRIVVDGSETVVVEKKRVVCGPVIEISEAA